MAEGKQNTKKVENVEGEKMVKIRLKRDPNPNAEQQVFYSYNLKNYIIKRGEEVEVPEGLWLMIQDNENEADFAAVYAEEHKLREA